MTEPRRILILTFYHPPDLAAGSFRVAALIHALRAASPDILIDVITTLPNRYSTFATGAPEHEESGGTSVTRIKLPTHRSGMLDQAKAFLAFARQASVVARTRRYDLVLATSSRLMTAALAARIAGEARAPLYLDLRDIFVDTIADVLGGLRGQVLKPAVSLLERWTVGRATRVNLVSRGFSSWFEPRYPRTSFSWFTNGVDPEFVSPPRLMRHREAGTPVRVLYAGNIGEGQGLHRILPALVARLHGRATFRVIGDGGRKDQLLKALEHVGDIELLAPMSRESLRAAYEEADVLFLHLNDYPAFRKVLPSKVFEYAATGKPVWAGVAGYSAEFIDAEVVNSGVFAPCDVDGAVAAFDRLELRDTPRDEFIARFSREGIMRAMARDVLSLMPVPRLGRAP